MTYARKILSLILFFIVSVALPAVAATPLPEFPDLPLPGLNVAVGAASGPQEVALTLQIVALITVLSMAPAILLLLTSFIK